MGLKIEKIEGDIGYEHSTLTITLGKAQNRQIAEILSKYQVFDPQREYTLEIKPIYRKRSLDANNYSWTLTGKIADKMNISKDEAHRLMLARYGQTQKDSKGDNVIITVKADIPMEALLETIGYVEPIKSGVLGDREYTAYRVIKGSSEYNTREMAIFIDGIISECQDLGIEVLPPDELKRLKELWKGK